MAFRDQRAVTSTAIAFALIILMLHKGALHWIVAAEALIPTVVDTEHLAEVMDAEATTAMVALCEDEAAAQGLEAEVAMGLLVVAEEVTDLQEEVDMVAVAVRWPWERPTAGLHRPILMIHMLSKDRELIGRRIGRLAATLLHPISTQPTKGTMLMAVLCRALNHHPHCPTPRAITRAAMVIWAQRRIPISMASSRSLEETWLSYHRPVAMVT